MSLLTYSRKCLGFFFPECIRIGSDVFEKQKKKVLVMCFSFCKINFWTYLILGEADKEKAKGKKKQWWRPWVDHASSRFFNNLSNNMNLTLISLTRMKASPRTVCFMHGFILVTW